MKLITRGILFHNTSNLNCRTAPPIYGFADLHCTHYPSTIFIFWSLWFVTWCMKFELNYSFSVMCFTIHYSSTMHKHTWKFLQAVKPKIRQLFELLGHLGNPTTIAAWIQPQKLHSYSFQLVYCYIYALCC